MKKIDWHIWGEWPGIPWFHSCYNPGLALELGRRSGFALGHFAADYHDGVQRLYLLRSEWKRGGEWYLHEVLKSPRKLAHNIATIECTSQKLLALNRQIFRLNVSRLSSRSLASWYRRFHEHQHEVWCAGMVTNLLELNQSCLSSYLRHAIESRCGALSPEEWQTLITPTQLSAAQHEERAFLRLVVAAQRHRGLIRALRSCGDDLSRATAVIRRIPRVWRALQYHYKIFSWVQFGWTGPATSFSYYLDLFVRFARQKDTAVRLQSVVREDRRLEHEQPLLERRLISDVKHRRLLQFLRDILFTKVYRMDALYHGYAVMEPLLKEIGKRLSLSLNQVYMVYAPDMLTMLARGKADSDRINAATQYSAYVKEGGRLRFYIGDAARKKMAPILAVLPKQKNVRELKGEIGYPGKVRGRVTIVDRREDMPKLKRGDILVSHATDPSLLPAMERAKAFVTDLGGLTAHAAIVAREMKKPCIIGTKVATKVFKDGDRVEVDAMKGIVRKI